MTLRIVKAVGLVTVQDLGRPGRMHEGLPPGGALVPWLLVRANRAVGNPDEHAAIEVCGQIVVRAERDVRIATDGNTMRNASSDDRAAQRTARDDRVLRRHSPPREIPAIAIYTRIDLRAGDELAISSDARRVVYLAVRGGIHVPIVLGGRGAHLSAGIGALLRAGDRIAVDDHGERPNAATRPSDSDARDLARAIRVLPGPDVHAFAQDTLDALLAHAWRVSPSSNRVGTRLDGPVLVRRADYVEQSRPMVLGAIEVPRDGQPIVLGPEHPTTGGYPVLAVVASDSLDAFHSIPLGGRVRFRV